jgi:chromosome segregation ATPase
MADAYCKVHGNTPEADRHKPATGEWTSHDAREYGHQGGWELIADAHNAALAAKQQELEATAEVNALLQNGIENRDNQLAAEREEVKRLIADKVMLHEANQQLREQLSGMELELQRSNAKCAEKASQLAAAQAAFVKLKSAIRDVHWHGKPLSETLNIDITDTTALNAAIAAATSEILKQAHEWREMWEASEAAQQPLVDGINEALQRLSAMEDFMPSRLVAVGLRHALSNMKEGK